MTFRQHFFTNIIDIGSSSRPNKMSPFCFERQTESVAAKKLITTVNILRQLVFQ